MSARLLFILFLSVSSVSKAQTPASQSVTVYFDFNSSDLSKEARNALDQFLNAHYIRGLGIFGHTDQVGSPAINEWLSLQRARVVRDYILSKGLHQRDLGVLRGFGADRPISNKLDSASRRLNRRVVLTNKYKATALDSSETARQAGITQRPEGTPVAAPVAPVVEAKERVAVVTPPPPVKKEEPVVKQQKSEKLIEDIKDKNTKAGENIVLKNINFYEGSHAFLPSASEPLEDLAETMKKVPTLEVEIQGHVCCQDGDNDAIDIATNEQILSVNRAKAVYNYLIEKGIDKNRLSYKGLAHQFPLIKEEATEADRITNRRVEIKIIKK